MSSPAQILANQTNSLASTGPITPEGKAVVSRNALKFGLTSKQIVLPHEDPADFEALLAGFISQIQPATDFESLLVQDAAVAEFRGLRIERTQTAWIAAEMKKHAGEDADITPSCAATRSASSRSTPPPTVASAKTPGRS